jgi:hypothetical protein
VTTAEKVVDDAASFASTENCRELLSLGARLAEALAGSGGDVDRTREIVKAYAEQAPEEIRAAFRVISDAYDEIAEAIGDVDLTPGETPSPETLEKLQQATAGIDQGAVAKASADIAAWVEANC